jgi:hypothetical protein
MSMKMANRVDGDSPSVRNWLRFHLSTGIVITLLLAVLLFLQLRSSFHPQSSLGRAQIGTISYGWPCAAYSYEADRYAGEQFSSRTERNVAANQLISENLNDSSHPIALQPEIRGSDLILSGEVAPDWRWSGIAINLLVTILILSATVFILEHRIRRSISR